VKIPKYMYEPLSGWNRHGIDTVRKVLEIEATLYRKGGQNEAATALRNTARMLKRVSSGQSIADAFDFPKPQDTSCPNTEGQP